MLTFTIRCEQLGVVVALFSNTMLFYLLTFKANTSYGAYRRLMFSYTIVELMYSVISVMSGMMAHSTETSFVVFDLYEGYVSRYLAPIFLS